MGHVSRSLMVSERVSSSLCRTVVLEKCVSQNPTVSMRMKLSCARSPCAEAGTGLDTIAATATSGPMRRNASRAFIESSTPSDLFQVAQDRPHRQVAADELADPVPSHGHCRAERKRHVLRLLKERSERAAFDHPEVL